MGTKFQKIEDTPLAQKVVDQICGAILSGQYKSGDKLPTEPQLAEMFDCGRSSVREAVKILVSHGVLEIRRAKGTYVVDGMNRHMINPLVYGLLLYNGKNSREEMIEFQISIDKAVSKMAADKCSPEDAARLKDALDALADAQMLEPRDLEQVLAADREFHRVIAEITRNAFMILLNKSLWDLMGELMRNEITYALDHFEGGLLSRHTMIYEAIVSKNSDVVETAVRPYYLAAKDSRSAE